MGLLVWTLGWCQVKFPFWANCSFGGMIKVLSQDDWNIPSLHVLFVVWLITSGGGGSQDKLHFPCNEQFCPYLKIEFKNHQGELLT